MSSNIIDSKIQVLIIQRLPIKSLIRFISVCKAWKSLITSSEFVAGYGYHHTQPAEQQHLMIKYEVGDWKETEVKFVCYEDDDDSFPQQKFVPTAPPFPQLFDVYRIVDSSCGLLYVDGFFREPVNSKADMVVLWNPLIRKSIAVALPTDPKCLLDPDRARWPFGYVVGFGVCPHTNDPKLVRITYIQDHRKIESISCIPNQVMVFALSSGEWTTSCNNLPRKSIQFDDGFSRVVGQFIYWLAYERIVEDDGLWYYNNLIMSFDLSNEEFREIDLPDSLTDLEPESSLRIFRLKESLALVEFDHIYPSKPCVVWMLDHDDPKSFTKLFTIETPHASTEWILGFSKSGEPIFEFVEVDRQDSNTSWLVVYDPCSGNIKHLGVSGNRCSFFGSSYTESLLLLDHDDSHIIRCGAVKTVGTGLS